MFVFGFEFGFGFGFGLGLGLGLTSLPQVYPRRVDRRHLLKVEDRGVQEEEGGKVDRPSQGVSDGMRLQVPELDAVVDMPDVVDDPRVGERQRARGEDNPPQPLAHELRRPWPQRRQARVHDGEEYPEGERDEMRVAWLGGGKWSGSGSGLGLVMRRELPG